MEAIEAVPEAEPSRDSRGRKVFSAPERERLLANYEQSGLTQQAFCRREGINYHTFVAWLGRRRKQTDWLGCGQQQERFVEMVLPAQGGGLRSSRFELVLKDSMVVRTDDESALAKLIHKLLS